MSDDEKGFLARWSQRKRDAGKAEPKAAAPDQPRADDAREAPVEAEPPFDLDSLPKLDELTASTDMTVFFKKGVPEGIRNAALRKSWALDPAVRNYVNPALDYAYDWNTPGGVPGAGELSPGTDIARMVSQVFGESPSPAGEDTQPAERTEIAADEASEQLQQADMPVSSLRLSDATQQPAEPAGDDQVAAESSPASDDAYGAQHSFASQQESRRHGSARPK